MVEVNDLERELRVLRKGLGLRHPDLKHRVGEAIRLACDIETSDSYATIVRKIRETVDAIASDMDDKLLFVLRGELNILAECKYEILRERQEWIAAQLSQSPATIRKWGDKATEMAASLIAALEPSEPELATPSSEPSSKYIDPNCAMQRMRTFLRMDLSQPEALEEITIVSYVDDLTTHYFTYTLPDPPEGADTSLKLGMEILYGGELCRVEEVNKNFYVYWVELPRSLRRGERHTMLRRATIPSGQHMAPLYAFVHRGAQKPRVDREPTSFDLKIKFDRANLPKAVWLLPGVPAEIALDRKPGDQSITPDKFGEVYAEFPVLRPGFCYGVAWL